MISSITLAYISSRVNCFLGWSFYTNYLNLQGSPVLPQITNMNDEMSYIWEYPSETYSFVSVSKRLIWLVAICLTVKTVRWQISNWVCSLLTRSSLLIKTHVWCSKFKTYSNRALIIPFITNQIFTYSMKNVYCSENRHSHHTGNHCELFISSTFFL